MRTLGPGGTIAVVDVGGTEIKTAALRADGTLADIAHTPTPQGPDAPDRILEAVARHVGQLRTQGHVDGLGLIVPGIVDAGAGVAVFSENLGWTDVPFRRLAAERTGLPVGFGHDVAAAGRAEFEFGAAADTHDAAVLVVGTGIAAALFSGGRPILARGWAGELGHSIVEPGGARCRCGSRGCLEAIASSAAIARSYSRISGTQVAGSRDVLELVKAGDATAGAVWDGAIHALAAGIRQLAALLSPDVVVIGGGLSRAGEDLLGPLRDAVAQTLPPHRVPELRQAAIGAYAGLFGAALLGREAVTRQEIAP